ncbi:alpha/beta fold hydrolase [Aestuariivirga sp. YIM B02566]|uniref:Alpha/beta hydrolase n=1 Tax=Taklimakanibacter albus TaxID=2800327 RepID=A0ACC5R5K2_9HYPH|nr:alpha/beta hydrolase [Aestuariivirga sp. YIM B02566]
MDLHPPLIPLTPLPGNGLPEGLVATLVTAKDGRKLRAAYAVPNSPKGTVVLVCGRGDFIERWFETIADFVRRGFAVATFDFRGQGGSERAYEDRYRDGLKTFSEYDDDFTSFMMQVVLPDCPPPFYAIGHSTGGLVLLRALTKRTWFERAVLSAPLIGVDTGFWPLSVVRLLCAVAPKVGLGRLFLPGQSKLPIAPQNFPGNNLTSDQRRFHQATTTLAQQPDLGVGGPTFSWLNAALHALRQMNAFGKSMVFRSPILIVAAGRDRIVDNEATRRFCAAATGVSLAVIPEARHEILFERDSIREQFFAAFDAFTRA